MCNISDAAEVDFELIQLYLGNGVLEPSLLRVLLLLACGDGPILWRGNGTGFFFLSDKSGGGCSL